MYFAVICKDKPDAKALRMQTRQAHLDYAASVGDEIFIGGPLMDEAGEMIGSLLILDLPDRAAVNRYLEADPYVMAGLFASVEVRAWKKVVG